MNTVIEKSSNFLFEYYISDMLAKSSIGQNKDWEPHITNFVKLYNSLYRIQNIIDVGANFGYHSLLFSREVKGNVYSFEPQSQNFNLLTNNIKRNNIDNIVAYNFACGDLNCDIQMPIIEFNGYQVNMGDFTPNHISTHRYSLTKSIILDEMNFPQIDIIKIDVQGWEKKVILGCSDILKKYKPVLIVEFEETQLQKTNTTSKELFDFIRNNNYYIFFLDYEYPSDHLCVHNDKIDEFRMKFKDYIFDHSLDNNVNHNIQCDVREKIKVV
jgi:FkbM family methyltransferase